MKVLRHFINFYLYSNLHIGVCAACLCAFSYWANTSQLDLNYVCFLFSGTVALYGIHRLIGINKVKSFSDQGRFEVINQFRLHIKLYAGIAGILAIVYASKLSIEQMYLIVLPMLLGLLYVVPILPKARRIRDLPYIKIFLISITWSFLTITIPLAPYLALDELSILSVERFLFIFAITIPFDLRDKDVDIASNTKTLATLLGTNQLIGLSHLLLILCALILLSAKIYFIIQAFYFIPLLITYVLTAILISSMKKANHDYQYTGLLDGVMILPLILLILSKML